MYKLPLSLSAISVYFVLVIPITKTNQMESLHDLVKFWEPSSPLHDKAYI